MAHTCNADHLGLRLLTISNIILLPVLASVPVLLVPSSPPPPRAAGFYPSCFSLTLAAPPALGLEGRALPFLPLPGGDWGLSGSGGSGSGGWGGEGEGWSAMQECGKGSSRQISCREFSFQKNNSMTLLLLVLRLCSEVKAWGQTYRRVGEGKEGGREGEPASSRCLALALWDLP